MFWIGIHCEGPSDELIVKTLIDRIVQEESLPVVVDDFKTRYADGSLTKESIAAAMSLFVDIDPACQLAVFITDEDNDRGKLARIVRMVRERLTEFGRGDDFTIFACPEPVIEQWLLSEEDALKNILGLDATVPLPASNIRNPKHRLGSIIEKFNKDLTKSRNDVYQEVVTMVNLSKLKSNEKSFRRFYEDLIVKIRPFCSIGRS